MHRRDLNLGLRGNRKTTTITCVEIVKNPQNPWNPPLITFIFKDEGSLANHPLSCHPQRVFGSSESEGKERKNKEGGTAERFSHDFINEQKERSSYSLYKWLI